MKEKDYKKWHNKKTIINHIVTRPEFNEHEIWFCYLGANVGYEQDGSSEEFLRPVVILKKFNKEVFWAIPLTKSYHKIKTSNERYYHVFSFTPEVKSVAILSQIRLIDAKRLSRRIGKISEVDLIALKEKLKRLCA